MIRPSRFNYNPETAQNNSFQIKSTDNQVSEKAIIEFDRFVQLLINKGIQVTVSQDTIDPYTPDSIFPNNWISFHEEGIICLYPMFAENRRKERKQEVMDLIKKNFKVLETFDFTEAESSDIFLEGTGSMVLDRENKICYACLSVRTSETLLNNFCTKLGYSPVVFHSLDNGGLPIYHTNVMMCIAEQYVVICLDSIPEKMEREKLLSQFKQTNKVVITISIEQMNHFAGNMLQVSDQSGKKYLVMSTQAYHSLNDSQIKQIESFNEILHSDISTIESNGGGSARCMMAEVFLTRI